MSKPDVPPPPDYSALSRASEASAQMSYDLGQQQLAWAKDQYAQNKATSDKVIDSALATQKTNNDNAAKDRERYESTFQPLEDNLAKDAQDYSSQARQEFDAGKAQADVSQQFDAARNNAQQRLESFGIDPSQTRAAALDISTRTQEAAARASAGNQARTQDQAVGRALRSEAINIGKGYPGQIAQTYGTATQSGNQAVNSGIATTATGAQTMGTPTQWQGLGNQAVGTWGNILNQGYQNQMSAYNAKNSQSSGIGSLIGMGMGMFLEDGGAIPDPGEGAAPQAPQDPKMHGGIPVRASMSPSNGEATDDIPARLNAGEFIVPKDTVEWYGEKHLQQLIEKARKERQGAVAKPQMKALPPEAPAVRSAIPTG